MSWRSPVGFPVQKMLEKIAYQPMDQLKQFLILAALTRVDFNSQNSVPECGSPHVLKHQDWETLS